MLKGSQLFNLLKGYWCINKLQCLPVATLSQVQSLALVHPSRSVRFKREPAALGDLALPRWFTVVITDEEISF